MFLRETVLKKPGGAEYRYWRLVKTFWDKKLKKVRHKAIAQLGKLKPEEVAMFKERLSGEATKAFSWESLRVTKSYEYLCRKIQGLKIDDFELIFYDITASYFEQSECELAQFGVSRDHRRDKKQIVLAMAVTKKGFPFYWKIFSGNTADTTTVKEFVTEIKERFKVKKACLVMDKGMVSNSNLEKIEEKEFDYVVTLRKASAALIGDNGTNLTVTKTGLTLTVGQTYYFSVRAVNGAVTPLTGPATNSNGQLVYDSTDPRPLITVVTAINITRYKSISEPM